MQQNAATVEKKGLFGFFFVCERGGGCLVMGGRGFRICFCISDNLTGRGRGGARRSPKK